MLTELGKFLRKMRLDHGVLLKEMADRIGYSPAFLSAVELGRKTAPNGFVDRIVMAFGLSADTAHQLQRLCSIKPVKITPHTLDQNFILEGLARKIDTLSFDEITELKKILGGNSDESSK